MPMNFDLKKYMNPVFIETGTWYGDGVKRAFYSGFGEVHSIEYSPDVLANASNLLANELIHGRIRLYCGDTVKMLPMICEKLKGRPATFWLDAHHQTDAKFVGGDENRKYPLYEELEIIKNFCLSNCTIMIDDKRLFEEWGLSMKEIMRRLHEINPEFLYRYENGFIENDVLVAFPKEK